MRRATLTPLSLPGLGLLVALTGCAGDDASMEAPGITPPSANQPVIEEPDLYKLVGNHLYVQNPSSGFNILDVSAPKKPRLLGQAQGSSGAGGEMYIRETGALVLLKSKSGSCQVPQGVTLDGWRYSSELLMVDHTTKTRPEVVGRYCLPGKLVASRTVGHILYVVQVRESGAGSQAISFDVSDPHLVRVVQQLPFIGDGYSAEIKVTAEAIFVASAAPQAYPPATVLTYIEITPTGKMIIRDDIDLQGEPRGRFHMDVNGGQFRIVTYDSNARETRLYVIDISEPGNMKELGQLTDIGRWEQLYATRFVGDLAYVVTFRQTDPLWVISLADPTQPRVIGELHVPGWSDFIFPRGDTLITVGRGDNGGSLGLSLFDVSDPTSPQAIDQISLGDPSTRSEANVDHRAVTILERDGQNPVVVVPHTVVDWQGGCELVERVQLVEVTASALKVRGSIDQQGTTRRTLLVAAELYSISDQEVVAIDISDLDAPSADERVTVGPEAKHPDAGQYCSEWGYYDDMYYEDNGGYPLMWSCNVGSGQGTAMPPVTLLLGLLWLGCWRVRHRR